jgi:hypothetical protein
LGHNLGVRRVEERGSVRLPLVAVAGVIVVAGGLGIAVLSAPQTSGTGVAIPAHVHPGASAGEVSAADGHTDHTHLGPALEVRITDPETRRRLEGQLAAARRAVKGIRTAADAMALGYVRVTVDLAYLGVHYMHPAYVGAPFDPAHPTHLIFGSDAPEAPLVGLMYYVDRVGRPPSGFAGPNDLWHRHLQACMSDAFMLALDDISNEQCAQLGGAMTRLGPEFANRWMLHVWVVPGEKNPWGTFANGDPALA